MMIRCVAGIVTPNLLAPRPGPAFATPSTASGQLNEAALHHVLSGHSAATFLDASGSPRFQVPFRPSCQQTKQFQCHCSLRSTAPLQECMRTARLAFLLISAGNREGIGGEPPDRGQAKNATAGLSGDSLIASIDSESATVMW